MTNRQAVAIMGAIIASQDLELVKLKREYVSLMKRTTSRSASHIRAMKRRDLLGAKKIAAVMRRVQEMAHRYKRQRELQKESHEAIGNQCGTFKNRRRR